MQALCSLREFVTSLREMPQSIPQVERGRLFSGSSEILRQMSCETVSAPLSPAKLRELIAQASPMFAGSQQQDAHEFLLEYVNQLHDELLGARKAWLDEQSMVEDEGLGVLSTQLYLDSQVQKTLRCIQCKESRDVFECFRDFSLDFPPAKNVANDERCDLRSMLCNYFEHELLEVKCEHCTAAAADMHKHLTLAPRVLVLHLKRFVPNIERQRYEKQHQNVDIPLSFDLKKYLREAYTGSDNMEVGPAVVGATGRPAALPARPLAAEASSMLNGAAVCCTSQTTAVWEVILDDRGFVQIDADEAKRLEEHFRTDPNGCFELQARNQTYSVDLANLSQVNKATNVTRPIRRRLIEKGTKDFTDEMIGGPMYDLRSIVAHEGASPHSGHYVCYARGDTGKWRLYDDSFVKDLSSDQDPVRTLGLGRKAYILFYVLRQ
jgi:uncharacterized UBP type Zn finger protein